MRNRVSLQVQAQRYWKMATSEGTIITRQDFMEMSGNHGDPVYSNSLFY